MVWKGGKKAPKLDSFALVTYRFIYFQFSTAPILVSYWQLTNVICLLEAFYIVTIDTFMETETHTNTRSPNKDGGKLICSLLLLCSAINLSSLQWLNFYFKNQLAISRKISDRCCKIQNIFIYFRKTHSRGKELNFTKVFIFYISCYNMYFWPSKKANISIRIGNKYQNLGSENWFYWK